MVAKQEDWLEAGSAGEAWDREGVLIGTFIAKQQNVGPNNSNMYKIRKENGEEIGVWGSAVLDSRFDEIPVGSLVKIECLGKEKTKRGNEFTNYKVLYKPVDKNVADVIPGSEAVA